jgi:archaellum component FlaG (FlaF/FlaG flagellin family)
VTYTYNTTNTGDTPLTVGLIDDQFGTIFTGKLLAPGESNITTIVRVLTSNTTNVATATGIDQLSTSVQAQATAFVHVIHPAISVTKTPSVSKALNTTSITYTYNVSNIGDTPLTVNLTGAVYGTLFTGQSSGPARSVTTIVERST